MTVEGNQQGEDIQPLPLPGTVFFRSSVAGFSAGALLGFVYGVLVARVEQILFGLVGAASGAFLATPVGVIIGIAMAVWFRVAQPKRETVRLAITLFSMAVVTAGLWVLGSAISSLFLIVVPLVGLVTWLGLLLVLKPTRSEEVENAANSANTGAVT